MQKAIIALLSILSFGLISCGKHKNQAAETGKPVILKFKLSEILLTKQNKQWTLLDTLEFFYTRKTCPSGKDCTQNNFEQFTGSTTFIIPTNNKPFTFTNNSFYANYRDDDHKLGHIVSGRNAYVFVDLGEFGKWVQVTENLWQSFPKNSPCDLSFDHTTQTTRVYSPGETYEINFYINESYLSSGAPNSNKSIWSLSSSGWLMCDIVKQ